MTDAQAALGTGINPDQIPPQEQIVADFNASQSTIRLEVQFVETSASIDTLSTLIAAGDAPDLVGPVGVQGSNAFADAWLDLEALCLWQRLVCRGKGFI